jgi:hypothetical protein
MVQRLVAMMLVIVTECKDLRQRDKPNMSVCWFSWKSLTYAGLSGVLRKACSQGKGVYQVMFCAGFRH